MTGHGLGSIDFVGLFPEGSQGSVVGIAFSTLDELAGPGLMPEATHS
jgi:hypothetical protein